MLFSVDLELTEQGYVLDIVPEDPTKFPRLVVRGKDKKDVLEALFEAIYLRFCT